jgi:glutaredoxin-related protein
MKIDCIIGIDPGASGGIAVWKPNGYLKCVKMPKRLDDLKAFLEQYKKDFKPIVFIEKLSIRPDDVSVTDGKANMGKMYRIQTMMQNFEQLKAIVHFLNIPYILVNPMKWQNDLKLRIKTKGRKEETPVRKRRYRDIAGRLYPEFEPTLWSGDATLIMHFGRLVLQSQQNWVLENLPTPMHNLLF